MKINHNIQALNAYRNLSQTMNQTSKTLEKLSSGMRINKAADDAAGLAISEKMRSQIRGLDMAERNAMDGISLIQTAEGALNETHSILQRMRELAVQASNGTLEEDDREAIQKEINQLTYEIDRIADTTQFNQKKLLSGSEEGRPFAVINSDEIAYDMSTNDGTWSGEITEGTTAITFSDIPKDGDRIIVGGLTIKFGTSATPYSGGTATVDVSDTDLDTVLKDINTILTDAEGDFSNPPIHSVNNNSLILGPDTSSTNGLNIELKDSDFATNNDKELDVDLQIGANAEENLSLTLGVMDAAKLGIAGNGDGTQMTIAGVNAVTGVDVSSPEAARRAITAFENAISLVSEERSKLGAFQNRLEHTITNLQTANENLTAAESRIRDTDMAKSMTEFTKNNILNQAGQAMLAQANQLPQGVLQLLK
ncbi:flagellin N-terminal helical domain-containing protein [Bacillus seohaeanensis]|uniref:Flagellin n=1 Tax=Bacillus seohaeanensis TaxID=284580 RepID=A0ABW5RMD6_9BACI